MVMDRAINKFTGKLVSAFEVYLVKSNQTLKTNFQFWKDQMDKPQVLGQCRLCNSGTMMLKKGKYGDFYSCSRYPACSNTIKLKSVKYGETV
jgi:ssDNA-binding Zn-finger/Zn-ribbon topoisomerase 1